MKLLFFYLLSTGGSDFKFNTIVCIHVTRSALLFSFSVCNRNDLYGPFKAFKEMPFSLTVKLTKGPNYLIDSACIVICLVHIMSDRGRRVHAFVNSFFHLPIPGPG
jgi:hypothetical protein